MPTVYLPSRCIDIKPLVALQVCIIMCLNLVRAVYGDSDHADAIVKLMDCYARDIAGGGEPLCENVKFNLASSLEKFPGAFSFLAEMDGEFVGLINCFTGFSTFKCQPIINIHDVIVLPEARGKKVCAKLLEKVEQEALTRGCCKLTLEVLENNHAAQSAYRKFGFDGYELASDMGRALFWQKLL